MYAMQFSPDGKTVAAIGDQDQVVTFDLATGNELDVLPDVRAAASPLVFSPDGRTLTTISGEQTLHFWDRSTGKDRLATPDSHHDFIQFLAFSPGGETLVSFSRDRTIRFWNLTTGRLSKVFPHDGSLLSVAFPAGGTPLGAGLDGSGQAQVWNLETGIPLHSWSVNEPDRDPSFKDILLSRDGSTAVALLADGSLRSWDTATGNGA